MAKVAAGTPVFAKWPRQGVTFDVRRGSFIIPAQRMPDNARAARNETLPGGSVRIHWRIIHVVAG